MKSRDFTAGMACGLAIGVMAGTVAALLLAPASGSETRRRLRYERDNTLEAARHQARRTMARLHLRGADREQQDDEDMGAFSGA